MSKVHCKRVINLVFNASNTIFANASGKITDEKKNSQWPFHALCKSLALHPRCNLVNINVTN